MALRSSVDILEGICQDSDRTVQHRGKQACDHNTEQETWRTTPPDFERIFLLQSPTPLWSLSKWKHTELWILKHEETLTRLSFLTLSSTMVCPGLPWFPHHHLEGFLSLLQPPRLLRRSDPLEDGHVGRFLHCWCVSPSVVYWSQTFLGSISDTWNQNNQGGESEREALNPKMILM